jgi:hypothetical protein
MKKPDKVKAEPDSQPDGPKHPSLPPLKWSRSRATAPVAQNPEKQSYGIAKRRMTKRSYAFLGVLILEVIAIGLGAYLIIHNVVHHEPSISNNSYKLTLHDTRVDQNGESVYRPGKDYKYVIVDISLHNNQAKDLWFAPVLETYLLDEHNTISRMAPAQVINPFQAGPIKGGQTAEGELSYSVRKAAHHLRVCYQPTNDISNVACLALPKID